MTNDILHNNRNWATEKHRTDSLYFQRLATLENPKYLWIGCTDNRTNTNAITGLDIGEILVHNTVANLVNPSDMNTLSVVEYAVKTLGVEHIIICGHYGCCGVQTAMDRRATGLMHHWLQPLRDTAVADARQLVQLSDNKQRVDRLCELSILAQVKNLAKTPILQNAWKSGRTISIHAWVYEPNDGLIRDLKGTEAG